LTPSAQVEIEETFEAVPQDRQESETIESQPLSEEKLDAESNNEINGSGEDDGGDRESLESQSLDKSDENYYGDSKHKDEEDNKDSGDSHEDGESEEEHYP